MESKMDDIRDLERDWRKIHPNFKSEPISYFKQIPYELWVQNTHKITRNDIPVIPGPMIPLIEEDSVEVSLGTYPNSEGVHNSKEERNSYTGWGQKLKLLVYKLLHLN